MDLVTTGLATLGETVAFLEHFKALPDRRQRGKEVICWMGCGCWRCSPYWLVRTSFTDLALLGFKSSACCGGFGPSPTERRPMTPSEIFLPRSTLTHSSAALPAGPRPWPKRSPRSSRSRATRKGYARTPRSCSMRRRPMISRIAGSANTRPPVAIMDASKSSSIASARSKGNSNTRHASTSPR